MESWGTRAGACLGAVGVPEDTGESQVCAYVSRSVCVGTCVATCALPCVPCVSGTVQSEGWKGAWQAQGGSL